jgi:hypothetical protein
VHARQIPCETHWALESRPERLESAAARARSVIIFIIVSQQIAELIGTSACRIRRCALRRITPTERVPSCSPAAALSPRGDLSKKNSSE